ncbi:MAG: GAF domain-containing protein [Desulfotignum sp.]
MENFLQMTGSDCAQTRATLSLAPLIHFWETELVPRCSHMAGLFAGIMDSLPPSLKGDIVDMSVLEQHHDVLHTLMTAVVPPASFDRDLTAAFTPCSFEGFYATPEFRRLFLDSGNALKPSLVEKMDTDMDQRILSAYCLVLERIYGFDGPFSNPIHTRVLTDEKTGLDRYYEEIPDYRFVELTPVGTPRAMSETDREWVLDHLTDMKELCRFIDLFQFEFKGFVIIRVREVTQKAILSALERDLVDENSIFSSRGIQQIESQLQSFFRRPDLGVSIASLKGDQILVSKNDHHSKVDCLFSNSHHFCLHDLEGSVWMNAARGDKVSRVADLSKKQSLIPAESEALTAGIRSMLLSPLSYQGNKIGLLEVFSPNPNDFGPFEAILMEQITPLFAVALKRGQDELAKHVQTVIKEQCTAVHPSVEWRFEKAAMAHLDALRQGKSSPRMEDIVFKDVVPFYGQADIRGSSKARNQGIQQDLTRQLSLARDIMASAACQRPWPLLQAYVCRIERLLDTLSGGVTSSDEDQVFSLLNQEVAGTFDSVKEISTYLAEKIDRYCRAVDPVSGMIHHKQKEYEDSVAALNSALSAYLEQEDTRIQESFPHYFEKRRTDGVDYMMYIGASMMENGILSEFHIKNMTLWQIMAACGMARQAQIIQPDLKIPLDVCHLILVNHTPLSIRFRYDEKRFDVDGAYDVRHEIIKSRLDKALVKGTGERLTQPGRIAVVYANPAEETQIQQHIRFLTDQGALENDLEFLDLDDMPDVMGLKAIRVGVNLSARETGNVIPMRAG